MIIIHLFYHPYMIHQMMKMMNNKHQIKILLIVVQHRKIVKHQNIFNKNIYIIMKHQKDVKDEFYLLNNKHLNLKDVFDNNVIYRVRNIFQSYFSLFLFLLFFLAPEREHLASAINLSATQVKIWFQNRT
jgi:hypothetical protein